MSGNQSDNETLLADEVRNIIEKINENEESAEESANLYTQLEKTLNNLIEFRKARYVGRGFTRLIFSHKDKPEDTI